MKTLKELWMAFIAFIACISMAACSSETDTPVTDEEQDVYTVKLGWGGELDVTYEPLSRTTTNDLYGIQVYSSPDKELEEGEEVEWTKYAYGLFNNADDIEINLLKGYKYKFEATIVKNGEEKVYFNYGYTAPFNLLGGGYTTSKLSDQFTYSSETYFLGIRDGKTFLHSPNGTFKHPNTDRYYGELENFTPGEKNNKANIKMKRASFGAKFIAKGKAANDGTLEIQITEAPKMELTPSDDKNHISDTFTFSDVKAAWSTNGNYSETIAVTINWHRSDGTTVPLGTHNITYKRNATTVVNVNVKNDGSSNGVGYEIDQTELGEMEEDETVNIEDGTIVETEVNTQGTNNGNN